MALKTKSKNKTALKRTAPAVKKAAVKVKAPKPGAKLSPGERLAAAREKAAANKAAGIAPKKSNRTPRVTYTYKPPEDFKPFFMDVRFRTSKDGLLGPQFKMERIKGNWDNKEAKRFNMLEYDVPTALAFISRLSSRMFATKPEKRPTGNTVFRLIVRVTVSKSDKLPAPTMKARVASVSKLIKSKKTGKPRLVEITDKKDADRKHMVRQARFLGGAFTNTQLPPSAARRKKNDEE